MASLNKITLIGHLGSDPTQSGRGPVKFSLATSKTWNRDGERQEKTQWHRIVIWNEHVQKFVLEYLKKGDLAYVEGEMEYRVWDKDDGEKVNLAEVCVNPYTGVVQSLTSRGGGRERSDETTQRRERERDHTQSRGSYTDGGAGRDLDDEIPF